MSRRFALYTAIAGVGALEAGMLANWPILIVLGVFLALWGITALFGTGRRMRRVSIPEPAGRPPHLCANCDYDLRGLGSPVCPECGASLAGPSS